MELEENKNNKIKETAIGWLMFLGLLIGYVLIPQIVGITVFKTFKLSEELSMFIGNMSYMIIIVCIYYKMFIEKIKDFKNHFSTYFGDSLKYWGIGLIVMYISNLILAYLIFPGEVAANEELNRIYLQDFPIMGFISVVILAPFIEEMIFRFGLKKAFPKTKYFPVVSAIFFGFPHVLAGFSKDATVIENLMQLLYVVPYGALGYAFGYIYKKSDNIFSSMLSHMMHNFMCFVVILNFV